MNFTIHNKESPESHRLGEQEAKLKDQGGEENEGALKTYQQQTNALKSIPPLLCSNECRSKNVFENDTKTKMRHKKKYTTGYGIFFREQYGLAQKVNPSVDFGTISKVVALMWRLMKAVDRKKYHEQVKRHSYSTNYGKFFHEQYKEIKLITPTITFGEISKTIAQKWLNLTQKEKRAYRLKNYHCSPSDERKVNMKKHSNKKKQDFDDILDISSVAQTDYDLK